MHRRLLALLVFIFPLPLLFAAAPPVPWEAKVAPASDEPARARQKIRVPQGFQLDLWAAEPLLANPVVFTFDRKGRAFVAETFRLHQGVTDIRGHMSWLDDDLSCRTVEDRVAMMRTRLGKRFADTRVHHERVRLVEDTRGAGRADKATVFAQGFRRPEDGIAAGLLARGDSLYYACIPDLWKLRDTTGDGVADVRERLHTGYGIHVGFIGHDLHGLILGPDGKLYFSIGDRGLNVTAGGKHLFHPDTGSVLRCNPDGSDLEVFATGLRNPQELAFDKFGNLFTGDNNSDGGDRARWVYLVEGGDCGWRIGYQFGGSQGNRGPWNAEKLWHPPHAGQAAWVIPPIANLADGPSGLTYYPGVGLPARYDDHFFLADFRGASNTSGIRSFAVKPKGAGFELVDSHEFLWGVLATDVDFGPDCGLYVSDWVEGWGLTGKGRLWKLTDPGQANDPTIRETKQHLGDGMAKRTPNEIAKLLDHRDMRVRLEAQWALADRGPEGVAALARVSGAGKAQLARVHAVWGLGQAGRRQPAALAPVRERLADPDAEVRAQAAKVLGEGRCVEARAGLIKLLKDTEPRVRFFAAQALGKVGGAAAFGPLVAMLKDNADADLYLRHAGAQGLAGCGDRALLAEAAKDASVAVRRAVVLAYRRLASPDVAALLNDADADIVAETARAIHDVPIPEAFPRLAALSERTRVGDVVGYRALNAHFYRGKADDAQAVARFAARPAESEPLRVEAVKMLGVWDTPRRIDRVMGTYRPPLVEGRGGAQEALRANLGGIFTGPDGVRREAARVAAKLGIKEIGPTLYRIVTDTKAPPAVRVETLRALAAVKDERVEQAVALALKDGEPRVRAEGRRLLAKRKPQEALASLAEALERGTVHEQQEAFDVLGTMKGEESEKIVTPWLERLRAGKVAPEVRLDLVEAAEALGMTKQLEGRPKDEAFGRYRDSLAGGDKEAGRRVFLYKSEVSCLRCHKAGGEGTGEVGPDLTGIGGKQTREYLLEAIVLPNKQIAKGYESLDVVLLSGQVRSGVLKGEDAKTVRLMTAEGATIVVNKDDIEERRVGKSAMPEDLTKHLSRREVRDLVEYLAGLRDEKK